MSVTADPVRTAILRMASSVAVLTVGDGSTAHGCTVSSTSVVSRRPPTVCVGLRAGSAFTEIVRRRHDFVVNVLSSGQSGLASWFADPDRPRGTAQFASVPLDPYPVAGAPVLRGVAAVLACRTVQVVPVADSHLLVARVVGATAGIGVPLLSVDGALCRAELYDLPRWPALSAATGLD